jgi:hypothetical protein
MRALLFGLFAAAAPAATAKPNLPTPACTAPSPSAFVGDACPIASCAAGFELATDAAAGFCRCMPSTADAATDFAALPIERECRPIETAGESGVEVVKVLPDHTTVRQLADGTFHRYQNQCKCLPLDGLVATPAGDVPVKDLKDGMPVWSRDERGGRVPVKILATSRVHTSPGHQMIAITLADGRRMKASAGHPLATGRPIESLKLGDDYDGSKVAKTETTVYADAWTRDLLPDGPTGVYWLNGVAMGSTFVWSRLQAGGHR